MSDASRTPDPSPGPMGPPPAPRPKRTNRSEIAGVFAGAGRGAGLGSVAGACACFVALTVYALYDTAVRPPGPNLTPGAIAVVLLLGVLWFGMISVGAGGLAGAVLGAMIGAFFPVRRPR